MVNIDMIQINKCILGFSINGKGLQVPEKSQFIILNLIFQINDAFLGCLNVIILFFIRKTMSVNLLDLG